MKLFLYWKDIEGKIYKLGTLIKDEKYFFILNQEEYEKALKNGCAGIGNLAMKNQESDVLFQFFRERIPGKDSPRLNNFLEFFNMDNYDEMELLKRSRGKVATDRFFIEQE